MGLGWVLRVWDGYKGSVGLGEWGWNGGLKDCSLGFYGKLQGESLWAGVWLDTLDRLAWMLLSKVVLYSGSSLD